MEVETFGTDLVIDSESYTDKNRSKKRWLSAAKVWDDAVDGFAGTATISFKFPAARNQDGFIETPREAIFNIQMTVGEKLIEEATDTESQDVIPYDELLRRSKLMDHPSLFIDFDTLTKNVEMTPLAVKAGDTIGLITKYQQNTAVSTQYSYVGNDLLELRDFKKSFVDLTL